MITQLKQDNICRFDDFVLPSMTLTTNVALHVDVLLQLFSDK